MEYSAALDFEELGRELIELLRIETDVPYGKCRDVVRGLLSHVQSQVPSAPIGNLVEVLSKDLLNIETCSDAAKLRQCLDTLSSYKCDSQERSWSLHEDEDLVIGQLVLLRKLLSGADKRVSLRCLADDQYRHLTDLVEFYQMEHREIVRNELTITFQDICLLHSTIVSVVLPTVLPIDIIRGLSIQRNKDPLNFLQSVKLLTLLFCTAEQPPYHHYDIVNADFVGFLCDSLESPVDSSLPSDTKEISSNGIQSSRGATGQHTDILNDALFKLLIALNLHSVSPEDSVLIRHLTQRFETNKPTKVFTQKLVALANREDDPLWVYKDETSPYQNAVLKLLQDMFATADLPRLFYSNDRAVLLDIVLREILDLAPGQLRSEYLSLLQLMLKHTIWQGESVAEIREAIFALEHNDDQTYPEIDYRIIHELKTCIGRFAE